MFDLLKFRLGARCRLRHVVGLSALVAVAAALVLVGSAASKSKSAATAKGGSLTFLSASDVASLDPGRVCAEYDYMVIEAIHRHLFYYKPGDYQLSEMTPDLASGPAVVSNGGKTVTVHIRPNVRFAPPVNRAVTSADIKYGIERGFMANVANCAAVLYYGDLVGAPTDYGSYKPISGIETPNKSAIVFHLKHSTAGGFVPALAMPQVPAVPKEYAQKYDQANPSAYARHAVGTGPYMIQSYKPGVSIQLVRNPNWKASTDFRPATLDRITISEGNADLAIAAQRALSGSSMVCCDQALPGPVLKTASQTPDQLHSDPAGGAYFTTLNYKMKPFDNINIRRAVAAIMDRESFLVTLGGKFGADPATGFLPRGFAGWSPNEGDQFDFMRSTRSNPEVAKKYMLLAQKQGVPVSADGKYTGTARPVIMGINTEPASKAPLLMQSTLQQLGIKSTVKLLSIEAYNSKFCYFTNLVPAVCAWNSCFKDFPEALWIASVFAAQYQLKGVGMPSKALNDAMTAAVRAPAGPKRIAAAERVNNIATSLAISIPFAWPKTVLVLSKNVVAPINPLFSGVGVDLAFARLK